MFVPFKAVKKPVQKSTVKTPVTQIHTSQSHITQKRTDYEFNDSVKPIQFKRLGKNSILHKYALTKVGETDECEYYEDSVSKSVYKVYKNAPNVFILDK